MWVGTFLIIGALSAIFSFLFEYVMRRKRRPVEETPADRVRRLSTSMRESVVEMEKFVAEMDGILKVREVTIREREDMLRSLEQQEVQIQERIEALEQSNPEAARVFAQLVNESLHAQTRASFRRSIIQNAVFFLLGAGFAALLQFLF